MTKLSKIDIKELFTLHQTNLVRDFENSIQSLKEDSDLDEDALKDAEDFSHQSQSKELERRLREQLNTAKADLSFIKNYSSAPCQKVQVGALVITNKNNFYICISYPALKIDDKQFIGISDKAPIYAQMINLKKGDQFEMANIKYKISDIL